MLPAAHFMAQAKYFRSDLATPEQRPRIQQELQGRAFAFVVRDVRPQTETGTASAIEFAEPLLFSLTAFPEASPGGSIRGIVQTDRLASGSWVFRIRPVERAKPASPLKAATKKSQPRDGPGNLWRTLIDAFIESAQEGRQKPQAAKAVEQLRRWGVDAEAFARWLPTIEELALLEMARRLRDQYTDMAAGPTRDQREHLFRAALAALGGGRAVALTALASQPTPVGAPTPVDHAVQPGRLSSSGPPSVASFGAGDIALTVYIDEAWNLDPLDLGVIGGIAWIGSPDERELPFIPTHLREGPKETQLAAIEKVLACDRAFPFVIPIRLPAGTNAQSHYDDLLSAALQILLGWVLPPSGPRTRVRVYCEAIEGAGHPPGSDGTEHYRGEFAAARRANPERFSRWSLEYVGWTDKLFEYVPYGDLMAYLGLESSRLAAELRERTGCRSRPGYFPLSLALLPRLMRIEHLESAGNVDDVLDMAIETEGTRLGDAVLADVHRRLRDRPELRTALLKRLDERFRAKTRDITELGRLLRCVREIVAKPDDRSSTELRLLWSLLELQEANHSGDPERGRHAAAAYEELRAAARGQDVELVAYADLHLAVHYADRFERDEALRLGVRLVESDFFGALRPVSVGRAWSSLGQAHAMAGRHDEAEQCFDRALAAFDRAEITAAQRAGEKDQTGVYRAINSLDANAPDALSIVESLLGPLPAAADRLAGDVGPGESYHHHLLVRTLFLRPEIQPAAQRYLARRPSWASGAPHPWPLIHTYRALLLWRAGADRVEVARWFERALSAASDPSHGVTLRLLGAMTACLAACCGCQIPGATEAARDWLSDVEHSLPGAGPIVQRLRPVLERPAAHRVAETLAALPFNYH
jgi:tetratricopeptide (TPR) repeat protein